MSALTSRSKLAGKNIAVGMLSKVVNLVLEFVSRAVFIQVLGAEVLGVQSVYVSLVQMMSLAELGITNAMIYSYYEPLATGDMRKLAALIRLYRRVFLAIAAVVALFGIVMQPLLPLILDVDVSAPELRYAFLLVVADTVISYLFVYRTIVLRADQKGYVVTSYAIVIDSIRVFAQILLLIFTRDFLVYLAVRLVATLSLNLLASRRAKKDYQWISDRSSELDPEEKHAVIDIVKSGFIYKVSSILLNNTTNILISIMVSTIAVGYLANYTTIIVAVTSISTVIFTNLTASVGNFAVTGSAESRRRVFDVMVFVGAWLTIVFVVCTAILSNDFIVLWLGPDYILPDSTFFWRLSLMFLSCIMQPAFSYREATGLYRETKYVMLLAALVNLVLSIVLGYFWGLDGILAGSTISCVVTYFWYEPHVLFKLYFDKNARSYYGKVGATLLVTVVLAVVGFYVASLLETPGWGFWLAKAAVCFLFCNLVCFILFRHRSEYGELKDVVRSLLNRATSS